MRGRANTTTLQLRVAISLLRIAMCACEYAEIAYLRESESMGEADAAL